jgi:phage shock protein PspC (stress-responsive transcriptional regulator)/signal transduction histidine kinase
MSTDPMAASRPARLLLRPERGYVGGVCAGIAEYFRVDPIVVRIGFVALSAFGGIGVALYVLAWAIVPSDSPRTKFAILRAVRGGAWRVALGSGMLVLAGLLFLRELDFWPGDAVVWPLVLGSTGLALMARQAWGSGGASSPAERRWSLWGRSAPARPAAAAAPAVPPAPTVRPSDPGDPAAAAPSPAAASPSPAASGSRLDRWADGALPGGVLGAVLILGAALIFLQATGSLAALRQASVGIVVVVAALALVFGPWMLRQARALTAERAERIRSQERAEMAAHVHDSVLQTLALVQRRAGDPPAVAALARKQERELRGWLSGDRPTAGAATLAAALRAAAEEIEEERNVTVEVVTVGDAVLDERLEALVAAAREAVLNAAKFSDAERVDLFAEVDAARVEVFVRDRGAGFDPDAVAADRRGVRESIVGRMERHRGAARISSRPGEGTEVELTMERSA